MATYKKNEVNLESIYIVELDYYLDETVFNGEYLKNVDGQLVYFGLQNADGDYINNLSDIDLTNCITSDDDNYTIKLEKVDNTAAKIFVNKPKKKLTLDKRRTNVMFYYINSSNYEIHMFNIVYQPTECSYEQDYYIFQINKIANPTFSFNNLYYVINYNGTGGVIDIDILKTASTIDITSNDLNKTFLHDSDYEGTLLSNIDKVIFTYYSFLNIWYGFESGYTPIDFLSKHYDKIYSAHSRKIFDYRNNKLSFHNNLNAGDDRYVYFCAINPANNTVVPVFKMNANIAMYRKNAAQEDVYTKYIVK